MSATTQPALRRDFAGAVEITGLARDLDGHLLVLDVAGRRVLELPAP
jgi:hypothetical protein